MDYYNEDQILQYFKDEIEKLSQEKIDKIKKEIAEIKANELNKIEEEVKKEIHLTLGAELKDLEKQHLSEINTILNESNYKLMKRREELFTDIFNTVKQKIVDFIQTERYETLMKTKLNDLAKLFVDEKINFLVNKDDKIIKKVIQSIFKDYEIFENPRIELGGFQAYSMNKGVEVDETLDSKLKEKKEWFYANSKLFIQY